MPVRLASAIFLALAATAGASAVASAEAPAGAEAYIAHLQLQSHPEGGYYRRSYTAPEELAREALPERFAGARPVSTAIHFLLPEGEVSALHRLRSDELWHFYAGDPLRVHMLHPDGRHESFVLGPEPDKGMVFQAAVPHGVWFGAELADSPERGFALVGNTVAPGFDFADFELAERDELVARYPEHRALIRRLTQ
jgi:hypothetical protein